MYTGPEIVAILAKLEITHVVWVPDSATGSWEQALEATPLLRLVRVCREGEAWPLAAGLLLGAQRPLVVMQTTGLFESGDALRNVVFDLHLPVLSVIGVRNWLVPSSQDSARRFAEPIIAAWGLPHVWIASENDKPKLAAHLQRCLDENLAGMVLMAEGPP